MLKVDEGGTKMDFVTSYTEFQLVEACMADDHDAAVQIVRGMTKTERRDLADALDAAIGLLDQRWDD